MISCMYVAILFKNKLCQNAPTLILEDIKVNGGKWSLVMVIGVLFGTTLSFRDRCFYTHTKKPKKKY